jgi:signal transduction histidine kinase
VPLDGSLAGQAISSGKPGLITGDRLEAAAAALGVGLEPLIAAPLTAGERVLGALLLGRRAACPGFTEPDLDMTASFAGHAAVAMELAAARAGQILLAQAEEHDRIAGDLHDHVIGELFALGMKLQGQAARSDPATAERVNGYADTLDDVIRKIRASIFGLQQPRQAPAGPHARIMEIIDEHAPQLGFTASASFTGTLGPGETLAHDILAVTREALSNCARHARATAVTISLARQDGLVTLDITDNGQVRRPGQHAPPRGKQRRDPADHRPAGGGTRLTWTARPITEIQVRNSP